MMTLVRCRATRMRVVAAIAALGVAGAALAQTTTSWQVGAGNWGDAGNWNAGVPTALDAAIVADGAAGIATVNVAGAAASLAIGGGANAKTVLLGSNLTVGGALTLSSNGTLDLGALAYTLSVGTLGNSGIVQTPAGGADSKPVISGATFTNLSGGTVNLRNGTTGSTATFSIDVVNQGTWNNSGTNIVPTFNGTFTNEGTLTRGGNAQHRYNGALINSGTINASGGVTWLSDTQASSNSGIINLNSGFFGGQNNALNRVLTNTGTIYGKGGTLNAQLTNSGAGKIICESGTTTLTHQGSGFFHGGTIEVQAGAGATLSGNAVTGTVMSMAVTNHGTWTSSSSGNGFRYDSGTAFENKTGATFYHSGSSGVQFYDDFNNRGTATIATGNTMSMSGAAAFTNFSDGTLNFSATGFAGPLVNHGVVNTTPGTSTINSPYVNEPGGVWTVSGLQTQTGGLSAATPAVNLGTMLIDTGGSLRFAQLNAVFENTGTVTVRGVVTESAYAREDFKNLDGGTIIMAGGSFSAGRAMYQAGSRLEGHGTFGTPAFTQTSAVTNHGAVVASGGTLTAAGWGAYTFSNTSMLEVEPSATMAFNLTVPTNTVTLQSGSTLQVAGTLALPAGNLRVDMSPENANWRDGLLILGDGTAQTQGLEVGGLDLGTEDIVFDVGNFNLGGLMLLDNTTLSLTNLAANQPGDDSLYVRSLTVGDNVTIDLNGYKLYYGMLFGVPTVLDYGVFEQFYVPEPGSFALLALAGLVALRRRRA